MQKASIKKKTEKIIKEYAQNHYQGRKKSWGVLWK